MSRCLRLRKLFLSGNMFFTILLVLCHVTQLHGSEFEGIEVDSIGILQDGTSSIVSHIFVPTENRGYVLKEAKIACEEEKRKENQEHIEAEINALRNLNHPNIVKLRFGSMDRSFLVVEYCDGGDLFNFIDKNPRETRLSCFNFFYNSIGQAIQYMHGMGFMHRDLKPENIFLCKKTGVKIGDFGFATKFSDNKRTYTPCGTLSYVAPEILRNAGYGKEIDWWSFGVILYIMLEACPPFDVTEEDEKVANQKLMNNILNVAPNFYDCKNELLQKLVLGFLRKNPKERATYLLL